MSFLAEARWLNNSSFCFPSDGAHTHTHTRAYKRTPRDYTLYISLSSSGVSNLLYTGFSYIFVIHYVGEYAYNITAHGRKAIQLAC